MMDAPANGGTDTDELKMSTRQLPDTKEAADTKGADKQKLTQKKLCLPPAMLAKGEANTKVSIGAAALRRSD